MRTQLKVLLSGRSKPELEELKIFFLKLSNINLETRFSSDEYIDPLHGIKTLPDILILHLNAQAESTLKALMNKILLTRPVILVISSDYNNPNLIRLAMQAGARDFYSYPIIEEELVDVIKQIFREKIAKTIGQQSRLTAVMNAKGGSGASIIACNIAHIMSVKSDARIALLDMDLQFGTQTLNFDLKPKLGIFEALEQIDSHDIVTLGGFLTNHKSGLSLLSALPDQIGLPGDISSENLGKLLDLMLIGFNHVVVDLPRLVDPVMSTVLDHADRIVICIQQNVANLRDAQRLIRIMTHELEISQEKIIVVINRYQDGSQIRLHDVQQTSHIETIICIPNDYARVNSSLNLGSPLFDIAPKSQITIALSKLAMDLNDVEEPLPKTSFKNFFSRFFS
ncbi:MAG: AAA family ATPase [Methylococcaceae bacterium]